MPAPPCTQAPAWRTLNELARGAADFDMRAALETDRARVAHFSQAAPEIWADLSKNLWDARVESALLDLARQRGVEERRAAMFAGEVVNTTEGRAVLHTLLRCPPGGLPVGATPLASAGLAEVHATLEAMLAYAERVRADQGITDIVNIGIGGSDLGPQMAVLALESQRLRGKRLHFVSNVDGHEIASVLEGLDPARALFLIASKTFTTQETMANAATARAWFLANGGRDLARHFAALTTNVEAARAFGIDTTFGFWDWVGGRYSLWSAIGLPIAIAIGAQGFRELLAGARAMDLHFRDTPLAHNLPVRLALLDIWYRDFLRLPTRCVAPYHAGLKRLPAYLQQLEMESNGKRVALDGSALDCATSAVVWGEPGTNGQHAFFQMLHQGTEVVPVEFIAVREAPRSAAVPDETLDEQHRLLLANALAQARALLVGQHDAGGHRDFPGNRPSSFLLLDRLSPASLGALIALYEHRVFAAGVIWGINSFDQFGVELGKTLAKDIAPRLASGATDGLDASTAALLSRLR